MLPAKIRSFVAVELPDSLRERIVLAVREPARILGTGVSWTRPENLHLTVKFLGDINREDVCRAMELLKEAVAGLSSVPVEVAGPAPFPPGSKPRMVVSPVTEADRLKVLYAQVERAMMKLGVGRENRRFTPHITLARARKAPPRWASAFDWETVAGKIGVLPVTGVTLFMSELGPGGPTYTRLCRQEIG
ncbi:MAG: RNA 2',3'-cyclic phosphodiesterase [Planctomycetes bacterium]|nr:RNA 2',3'-cyclic phosphodiesterase [Planctomycetota bacterium]